MTSLVKSDVPEIVKTKEYLEMWIVYIWIVCIQNM